MTNDLNAEERKNLQEMIKDVSNVVALLAELLSDDEYMEFKLTNNSLEVALPDWIGEAMKPSHPTEGEYEAALAADAMDEFQGQLAAAILSATRH